MTVNYTTNLALGQPVTGTESGTWGDDVNNSVTSYLDIAIAGGLAITVTTADVTLTLTQGTSSATNIGSTTAQYAILNVSGAMTAARNLILPSSSRQYVINNNTTGGYALTVKGSATSGVTMVNGESAHIYWNGSDYAKAANTAGVATFTNLTYTGTLTGSTGVIAIGTNQIYKDSSGNVGIGTSSPFGKLNVQNGTIFVGQSAGTTQTNILLSGYGQVFGGQTYGDVSIRSSYDGSGNGSTLNFYTSPNTGGANISVERMRIDTSGNVGIGTSSPSQKLSVVGNIAAGDTASTADGFVDIAGASTGSVRITRTGTSATNSSMVFSTTYSTLQERMRIDGLGNVGIGTSSPVNKLGLSPTTINNSERVINIYSGTTTAQGYVSIGSQYATGNANVNSEIRFGNEQASGAPSYLAFATATGTSPTERMRIDSSGNLLVGTTSASNSSNTIFRSGAGSVILTTQSDSTANVYQQIFVNPNGNVGSITTSGSLTSYNLSSDQRLKENIQDAAPASALIDAIQVRQFDWKIDSTHQRYGFIAQELVTVAPEAVHQPADSDEMMAVDYSKLVPMLVKEIQSLRKRLADAGIA